MGTVERKGPITAVLRWAAKAWPLHSCLCQSLGVGRPGEGVQTRQEAPVEGSPLMASSWDNQSFPEGVWEAHPRVFGEASVVDGVGS